jgi:hypothetical protein
MAGFNFFKKLNPHWLWFCPVVMMLGALLCVGLKNEEDPLWVNLDAELSKNYFGLDKAADSLQVLYENFHQKDIADDSTAFKLIAQPYVPTMEFSKFKQYFNLVISKKVILMSGVSGVGNTTLLSKVAALIATTDKSHRLDILCAPQFDLEYNKRFIGQLDEQGHFKKGKLLKFWDTCLKNPNEKFVCMIDDFDKINPETLFGPELWQKLDEPRLPVIFDKDTIHIPDNFYLLCLTHTGVSSKIELNNEHFKRFGGQEMLEVNYGELIMALREQLKKVQKTIPKQTAELAQYPTDKALTAALEKSKKQLVALQDTPNIKRLVYFFIRANEFIESQYGKGHQLGQWCDIRKMYFKDDFIKVQNTFIQHVNAFRPAKELSRADFKPIFYTINTNGKKQHSSPIFQFFDFLRQAGALNEFAVAGTFALVTGLFGWLFVRRRHRYIKEYTDKIHALSIDFETKRRDYDNVLGNVNLLKREFEQLVLKQKVNYSEASFFYDSLEDKMRTMETTRDMNQSFLQLLDVFLEDNYLSDSECHKLSQFLETIRAKISADQYRMYKEEIERVHRVYGNKNGNIRHE